MDSAAIALYYFKLRLEVSNGTLFRQAAAFLQRKRKDQGIQVGERLAGIVRQANLASPQSAITDNHII
jgi:hypothetical protein